MDRPTCGTCPYWSAFADMARNTGMCQRKPPAIIPVDAKGGRDEAPFGEWPRTFDGEFCGEHPDFPAYIASLKGEATPC